jgi:NAD(P)H-dependent FMN reductase
MPETPTVLAVCGSRRAGSYTRAGLRYALAGAAAAGAETGLLDLGDPDLELPLFHPDRDAETTGDVADALAQVRHADGVLLGSPVYHGSYSSAFRSFHDWCSFDEFEDTAVGLLATAGGGSYQSTLDHMRITVRGVHGWVVPHQVGIRNASARFESRPTDAGSDTTVSADADGDPAVPADAGGDSTADSDVRLPPADTAYVLTDESLRDRTVELGREVTTAARRLFD